MKRKVRAETQKDRKDTKGIRQMRSQITQARGNNLSTGAKIAIGIAIGVGAVLIVLAIWLNGCTG